MGSISCRVRPPVKDWRLSSPPLKGDSGGCGFYLTPPLPPSRGESRLFELCHTQQGIQTFQTLSRSRGESGLLLVQSRAGSAPRKRLAAFKSPFEGGFRGMWFLFNTPPAPLKGGIRTFRTLSHAIGNPDFSTTATLKGESRLFKPCRTQERIQTFMGSISCRVRPP